MILNQDADRILDETELVLRALFRKANERYTLDPMHHAIVKTTASMVDAWLQPNLQEIDRIRLIELSASAALVVKEMSESGELERLTRSAGQDYLRQLQATVAMPDPGLGMMGE